MPLSALLLLIASASGAAEVVPGEPAPAPQPADPAADAPRPPFAVRSATLSGGPLRGELFGLRLKGGGLRGSLGFTRTQPGSAWLTLVQAGLGVARLHTPEHLAVTDVALDAALGAGRGRLRGTVGVELRLLDVERVTGTRGELQDLRLDLAASLSMDAFRIRRTTVLLEARASGRSSYWLAWAAAGLRF